MKKLYLSQWDYNKSLIFEELKKMVLNNGGLMVSDWQKKQEKTKIYNRTIKYKIESKQQHVEFLETRKEEMTKEQKQNINNVIDNYLKEIITLEKQYKKTTRIITNNGYLQFVLNGFLYYIQFDDNPFFDFYYTKQPINDDLTIKDNTIYFEKLPKEELFIKDYYLNYTKKNLKDTAKNIYNFLVNAKNSRIYKQRNNKKTFHKLEG